MSDAAPASKIPIPNGGRALPAAPDLTPEAGVRPLPWPPWKGRLGSRNIALGTATAWLITLTIAVLLRALGQSMLSHHPSGAMHFVASAALQAPWTLAVFWTFFGGLGYGAVLLLVCGLAARGSGAPWLADPLGMSVMALILVAIPFDPRLRSLASAALFVFAAFSAAAVSSIAALPFHGAEMLLQWEERWLMRLLQDIVVSAPLLYFSGRYIEQAKSKYLGNLAITHPTERSQIVALLISLLALLGFCVTWIVTANLPVRSAIHSMIKDPAALSALMEAQRSSVMRNGALLALLLGTVCGGAALVLMLFRRYRAELGAEVNRNTEALRRRHLQLAVLQQISESVSRSLDPRAVYQELARSMARLTEGAQVAVYVPDAQDTTTLKLIDKISIRPEQFSHRMRLPIESTLSGQCYRTGQIVMVSSNFPVYIAEGVREQFQAQNLDAFLAVPITGAAGTLAVASVSFDRRYEPDDDEYRLFKLIGRAVGAALERAETHSKARQYAGDLGGLYRFSQQLAAEGEERHILQVAAGAARRLLRSKTAAFFTIDADESYVSILPQESIGTPAPRRVRCSAVDGAPENVVEIGKLIFEINDVGLICESIREVRTIGLSQRGPMGPRLMGGGWKDECVLIVPMQAIGSGGGPGGVLAVTFEVGSSVGLEEAGLAEEIARQTSAALRRARLIQTTQQQAMELRLLEQIGHSISQRLSMVTTLEQIVQNVGKLVAARWASVFVQDTVSHTIRMRATNITLPGAREISIPLSSQSLVVNCLREGHTLVSNDMNADPRANAELNRRFQTASAVCVPLGPVGHRFGVLMVNNSEPGPFSRDEVRRLEQVAQLASAAIERAQIYEEACQRADELILLNEVGHMLVENPMLETTLQRIADLVCRNFQLDGAAFLLLNEGRDALVARGISGKCRRRLRRTAIPLTIADISTEAFRHNHLMVAEDVEKDSRVHPLLRVFLPGARSCVVIPMAGGAASAGPVGVLCVWKTQAHLFHSRDLQRLSGVARLAAASVNRDDLGQALHASQRRLQEVVDGLQAMVVSIDSDGRIMSFNAAAERVSGLNRADVLGKGLAVVANPDPAERRRLGVAIARAFSTEDCSQELTVNWINAQGGQRKIKWTSSFLRGHSLDSGGPVGMVWLGIDVTEQMLLEAQLLQAQKMESVGALAGGMAHDFNNLLGGIIGQCVLARSQTEEGDPLHSALGKIESAAHRGADLTAKLMAFARKSVLQPRAVDIQALIRETTELLSGSLPRRIEIVTEMGANLPKVYGDPTQLQQVLLNLCVNARDAMPNGGRLTIKCQTQRWTDVVPRRANPGQSAIGRSTGVVLEVLDTGTGMSEEVQQHLFEPFFTTKEPGKGTGLGLSVVFGIVRSHAGQINCYSQPGEGTRFVIRLPAALESAGSQVLPAVKSQAELAAVRVPGSAQSSQLQMALPLAGSESILLIDDDAILRDTMRQLLERIGYTVRVAASGVEAMKLLDGSGFIPALVLLDVVMPGLAGPALLKELRKRLHSTPVVLMSGYSADQTVKDLLNSGARELVQKPFTLDTLAGAIRRAVEQSIDTPQAQ